MSGQQKDYGDKPLDATVSRRTFVGATGGLVAAAFLAACGGGDDDEAGMDPTATLPATGETPSTEQASDTPVAQDTATVPAAAEDVRDIEIRQFDNPEPGTPSGSKPDELIIAWGTPPGTTHGLDPQRHGDTTAESQLRHMYEPLVKFERDLQTISPALATEWDRIDDLTLQFKLREGVTFHNGEPFNAEAVRYSILRPLSDETPGDLRSTYAIIDDVEIVDEFTVNVITARPDPALLARLTGFHMTMVAPEWAAQGPEVVASEANGTGPYKLASWSPNEDLVMEANEDYWGGAPEIKRFRWRLINEQATRIAAVRAGDVHVAKDPPPEEIDDINASGGTRVSRAVSNRVPYYWMTVELEPYDDPRVRQAINMAANVEGVIDSIVLGNGNRVSTVLAPWIFGFDPTLEPYPDDPERARELLAEAGYPDGIDITMWYYQGRYLKDREVAESMCLQMNRAGIRCQPELRERSLFVEMQRAKETPGLIYSSWGNWFFDADNTFVPLFGCDQAAAFDDWRRPYGCNQELEDVIQEARIELDVERRQELYAEAQRILYEDAAVLFMYQLVDVFAINEWVVWEPRHDEMVWVHEMSWNE